MAATRLRPLALASALTLAAGLPSAANVVAAQADPAPVTVSVNARAGLATMPDTGIGINHAVWDTNLGTDEVSGLLGNAGVRMMRYPGGSYGDIYHWETHTAPGGFVAPNTDFDTFMAGVHRAGGQAIVIANYGTGSADEAAGWVRQANVVKGYGVKYWEIGNENYGNGHYGANWEADNHAEKTPAAYANEVVAYSTAMKAVDPSVKIGAVLTMPANWPDGIVAGGDSATWNRTVLSIAGPHIDFVVLHWYPSGTAAQALASTGYVADAMYLVRKDIATFAGPNPGRIGIALTETNVPVGKNTQPGALYAADAYATLLEQGVFTVTWWNTHNGIGNVSTVAGQTDYDDFGILSSATCSSDGTTCEPALDTPFAPYHAITMMSRFASPGDQFVTAATSDPLVTAHAARRPNGDLAVLLVNKDPDNARSVAINYAGFAPSAAAPTVLTFTNGANGISTGSSGTAGSQTLPPYSLTTLVLHPTVPVSGAPSAPGAPTASAVTDHDAMISWTPAGAGTSPIAKYEVYRQLGTTSEQWGETPGTSFTVHNLNPGTRYTVNVIARDLAGRVSWASPPVTVSTTAPAQSSCGVRFTDVSNWGSGFVGSVDLTNSGSNDINGWTLRFVWPTPWQQQAGGWNGTWSQDGTTVTITNADFNGHLTPGSTANIGFVGNYNGPNLEPILFTLNGILCTRS
jgi:hypothetical protein